MSSGVLNAEQITSASSPGREASLPGATHVGSSPAALKTSSITSCAYRTSGAAQTSSDASRTQSTTRTVSAESPFHANADTSAATGKTKRNLFMSPSTWSRYLENADLSAAFLLSTARSVSFKVRDISSFSGASSCAFLTYSSDLSRRFVLR